MENHQSREDIKHHPKPWRVAPASRSKKNRSRDRGWSGFSFGGGAASEDSTTRYTWQTVIFEGHDRHEATAAFDAWFGYGVGSTITQQLIRRQADGSLHLYLTHHPSAKRYAIHVTALMAAEKEEG